MKLFLRAVAIIVVLCFSSTQFSWSAPTISVAKIQPETLFLPRELSIDIPHEFGSVNEIIPAPDKQAPSLRNLEKSFFRLTY